MYINALIIQNCAHHVHSNKCHASLLTACPCHGLQVIKITADSTPTSWAARYNTSSHETDAKRRSLGFSFLFSFLPLPTMLQLHPHLAQMITVLLAPAHKTACPLNMGLMTPTWWTLQGRKLPTCQQQLADTTADKNVHMLQEQSAMSRNALVYLYTIGEPAACSLMHSACFRS